MKWRQYELNSTSKYARSNFVAPGSVGYRNGEVIFTSKSKKLEHQSHIHTERLIRKPVTSSVNRSSGAEDRKHRLAAKIFPCKKERKEKNLGSPHFLFKKQQRKKLGHKENAQPFKKKHNFAIFTCCRLNDTFFMQAETKEQRINNDLPTADQIVEFVGKY